ncbi:MAG: hypothetical protein AB8H03_24260 [Saprospiraceae bacterium]
MKNIIILSIISLLFFGCKDDKKYTLTGVIYKDCSKEPSANRDFILWQEVTGGLGPTDGGELGGFTTDENGNFSVTFKDDGGGDIRIETVNSNNLLGGIPILYRVPSISTDLGNLYINNRATIDFYLDVSNPYSSSDTLIILGVGVEILGPFTDGIVHTAEDIYWIPYYDSAISQGEKLGFDWGINPYSSGSFNSIYYEPTGCEEIDEFIIEIE